MSRTCILPLHPALTRAKRLLPDVEAELWPEASHAISGQCAQKVNARVLGFVDRIENGGLTQPGDPPP
jgi:hypothetical protein